MKMPTSRGFRKCERKKLRAELGGASFKARIDIRQICHPERSRMICFANYPEKSKDPMPAGDYHQTRQGIFSKKRILTFPAATRDFDVGWSRASALHNHRIPQQTRGRSPSRVHRIDMCLTCKYATYMSKMIQLRNVPDPLHRTLKARAAMAGMSLSDYLLAEIREVAQRPTLAELRDRLHARKPVTSQFDSARLVREERHAR
jgi:plasmid stability protein